MERTIRALEARRQFDTVLRDVVTRGDAYVVERLGEAVAVVVPVHIYEQWKRNRDTFFDRLEETARRVNMPEEEGMALALEAQRAARSGPPERTPDCGSCSTLTSLSAPSSLLSALPPASLLPSAPGSLN